MYIESKQKLSSSYIFARSCCLVHLECTKTRTAKPVIVFGIYFGVCEHFRSYDWLRTPEKHQRKIALHRDKRTWHEFQVQFGAFFFFFFSLFFFAWFRRTMNNTCIVRECVSVRACVPVVRVNGIQWWFIYNGDYFDLVVGVSPSPSLSLHVVEAIC